METIEKSIEVEAPLSMVYNQWTQFEEFPEFMEGVEYVKQLDDKRLLWRAEIGGKIKEWHAEIFEQIPDQRIAWRSMSGALNTGRVDFESLGPNRTRIKLTLNYDPEGFWENVGDALGVVSTRVSGDLKRFKEFIENRGAETGGWRGRIHGKTLQPDPADSGETSSGMMNQEASTGLYDRATMPRSKSQTTGAAASTTSTGTAPRRRGRPRKNPLPESPTTGLP